MLYENVFKLFFKNFYSLICLLVFPLVARTLAESSLLSNPYSLISSHYFHIYFI